MHHRIALLSFLLPFTAVAANQDIQLDTQVTEASSASLINTGPVNLISAEQLESVNIINAEDAVRDQPGVIVRKRYIGDPNATLGMRGSNMFQTARTLVFADGMPLHYLLQTRYSGAPRWSVIAPSEINNIEVIYGPFSAAYSGNAMGGVVNIHSRMADEREVVIEGSAFMQDYDDAGREQQLSGQKAYIRVADRIGQLQLLGSFQRLQNDGQPMSFYYSPPKTTPGTHVSGGVAGKDAQGNDVMIYGDSGVAETLTDLYKIRSRYLLENGEVRASLVYEERQNNLTDARSYLRSDDGAPLYSGAFTQDGHDYSASGSSFRDSEQQRNSLLAAIGGEWQINESWAVDSDINRFRILRDDQLRTARNPQDASWNGSGDLQGYDNTGWESADIRLSNDRLSSNMSLRIGYHYDHYELQTTKASVDFNTATTSAAVAQAGGETRTQALFAEYQWGFTPAMDMTLGLRGERWQGLNGFKGDEQTPDRHENAVSPKFSLGWQFADGWSSRYAIARAVRFPIVQELYENNSNDDVQQIADASLKPERGIHHNLNIQFDNGQQALSFNLFYDRVRDTIFNQTGIYADGNGGLQEISTFLNINSVNTRGADISLFRRGVIFDRLDARLNASAMRATIVSNPGNEDSEGKDLPRLPRWSQNLTLTWHQTAALNISASVRHASNSYNELDNSDHESAVFGAIDAYTFIDAKARWQINRNSWASLGIDNLNNASAYVHHPYPQRTLFIEGGYRF